MWWRDQSEKILTFVITYIACKIFGEKNTEAFVISKRLKFR